MAVDATAHEKPFSSDNLPNESTAGDSFNN